MTMRTQGTGIPNHTITRRIAAEIHDVVEDIMSEIATGVSDATGDYPDVNESDIVHSVATTVCDMHYAAYPLSVDWVWRTMYGTSWADR